MSETTWTDTTNISASPPAGWPKPPAGLNNTAYRSSKTGLNMLMREWRRLLLNDGVKVWAISPGFLATGLAGAGAEKLKQVRDPSYERSIQLRSSMANMYGDGGSGSIDRWRVCKGRDPRQARRARRQDHQENRDTALVSWMEISGPSGVCLCRAWFI